MSIESENVAPLRKITKPFFEQVNLHKKISAENRKNRANILAQNRCGYGEQTLEIFFFRLCIKKLNSPL